MYLKIFPMYWQRRLCVCWLLQQDLHCLGENVAEFLPNYWKRRLCADIAEFLPTYWQRRLCLLATAARSLLFAAPKSASP